MKKRLLALLLVVSILASFTACAGNAEPAATEAPAAPAAPATPAAPAAPEAPAEPVVDTEASLVIPSAADIVSLNMLQNCLTDTGLTMLGSVYDPFYRVLPDGSLEYYLAENLDINEDGTVYTLKLRSDATWHDGVAVTADDVVFTFNSIIDGSLDVGITAGLKIDGQVIQVEKVDDQTVTFTLPRASNDYLSGLSIVYLMPKHLYEGVEDLNTCAENMIGLGNGPFKVTEYKPGEKLVVERYDDYYKGPANYKTIEYRIMPDDTSREVALLNGEIDYMTVTNPDTLAKYEADENYDVHSFSEGKITYMQINQNSEIFQQDAAREAICKALNIPEIVAGAYGSDRLAVPATGTVICAGEPYYNEDVPNYTQDIELAKKLVAETGLDQKPLKLIYNNGRAGVGDMALVIQQQLKQVGITVEVTGMESNAFFQLFFFTEDGWDIGLNGWSSSGRASYCSWYIKGSYYSLNTYTSDELNALWTAADVATENKVEAYNEVSRLLQSYYTYIPLVSTSKVVVVPSNTHGWNDAPRGNLSNYSVLYRTK